MIYKYLKTINEFCDEIKTELGYTDYNNYAVFPFFVFENGDIEFGADRQTHFDMKTSSNSTEKLRGRIFLKDKVIGFWDLENYTDDLKKLFEKIQHELSKWENHINFFDGKWRVDLPISNDDVSLFKEKGYYTYLMKRNWLALVPITDFVSGKYKEYIISDEEIMKSHTDTTLRQQLKKKGFGKGFGSDKYSDGEKYAKFLIRQESSEYNETKEVIKEIISRFEEEEERPWKEIVDGQSMGECQSIVSTIKMWKIPGIETHFGEIKIEYPIDEDDYGKVMTHHWVTYKGQPLEFSKGTLRYYVDWEDLYNPKNPYEIEYEEIKMTKECHFPELFEMKKKDLEADNLDHLISQYGDEERAREDFDWFYELLKNLNSGGYIYRIIFLPDLKYLHKSNYGEHWTHSVEKAKDLVSKLKDMIFVDEGFDIDEYKPFLIEAKTNPDNIDFESSMSAFCEFPWEEEINIKNQKNIKIISIRELKEWEY